MYADNFVFYSFVYFCSSFYNDDFINKIPAWSEESLQQDEEEEVWILLQGGRLHPSHHQLDIHHPRSRHRVSQLDLGFVS